MNSYFRKNQVHRAGANAIGHQVCARGGVAQNPTNEMPNYQYFATASLACTPDSEET